MVICTRENKRLLKEIIELLTGKHISNITLKDKEQHGLVIEEKNVTFDILCEDEETGEEFLVEVQNADKDSFRDRMLAYSTYPVRQQLAEKVQKMRAGEDIDRMDYSLRPVYVISMVNFALKHASNDALEQDYISKYELRNGRNNEILTQSLNFVFLEMGRLKLGPDDKDKCKNLLERFIFSMKYMHLLTERPKGFDDPLLKDLYDATELASMTIDKREKYDKIMTNELDRICEISFARKEGEAEGRAEVARNLLKMGMPVEDIAKATSLSEEEINALK